MRENANEWMNERERGLTCTPPMNRKPNVNAFSALNQLD